MSRKIMCVLQATDTLITAYKHSSNRVFVKGPVSPVWLQGYHSHR